MVVISSVIVGHLESKVRVGATAERLLGLPGWRRIHAIAVLVDDDRAALLLLTALAIIADAVRDPGAPCRLPIGEHGALGAVEVLEAIELGERTANVPAGLVG